MRAVAECVLVIHKALVLLFNAVPHVAGVLASLIIPGTTYMVQDKLHGSG